MSISPIYADFLARTGTARVRQMRTDLEQLRDHIPDGLGKDQAPVTVAREVITDCARAVNWALELCDRIIERDAIEAVADVR